MAGAAAECRQVSATPVIISPYRGERPLPLAILAAAPPGWLRPQVQPPRVGSGHQVIELHSKTIELWKRGRSEPVSATILAAQSRPRTINPYWARRARRALEDVRKVLTRTLPTSLPTTSLSC
jgi:hypothetical protein